MAVIRVTRFKTDSADAEEMLAKRAALIAAIRDAYPGLTEARIAKLDGDEWLDVQRWDSHANLQAALEGGPTTPEAGAAFSLTRDATAENADVIDER